jgi:hypothetical protein
MEVANTLAYYNTATIRALKYFIGSFIILHSYKRSLECYSDDCLSTKYCSANIFSLSVESVGDDEEKKFYNFGVKNLAFFLFLFLCCHGATTFIITTLSMTTFSIPIKRDTHPKQRLDISVVICIVILNDIIQNVIRLSVVGPVL